MLLDLDRYYTPEPVARRVLEGASLHVTPKICADSTCGSGRLLKAANDVFGNVQCVGIDRDRDAIAALRRRNPNWILAVGDLLDAEQYGGLFANVIPRHVDLLVLNPPFSQGNRKAVEVTYEGYPLKGSVAMAHLLRSFELFGPRDGAIAIVPESLLYSEIDATARRVLGEKFSLRKIADLESCTFRGARAHATAVQILPYAQQSCKRPSRASGEKLCIKVIRGALPVHLMKQTYKGIPFVHSTDIRKVVGKHDPSDFLHTDDHAKGRINGWVVLIPRVGVPEAALVRAVYVSKPVQLSDCVIALQSSNRASALKLENRVHRSWNDFRDLYRGTGARYVTISRLKEWLASKNIDTGSD